MGPIRGVSNISENSATKKQDQETRGEGEIEISGALSLRIAMRTAAPSMVSALQTPVTPIMPLTTSTTRSCLPQWKRRRRRKHLDHSALRINQSTPAGCSPPAAASSEKRLRACLNLFERSEFLIDTSQKKSLRVCTRAVCTCARVQ